MLYFILFFISFSLNYVSVIKVFKVLITESSVRIKITNLFSPLLPVIFGSTRVAPRCLATNTALATYANHITQLITTQKNVKQKKKQVKFIKPVKRDIQGH